jgi:hypothetical protein
MVKKPSAPVCRRYSTQITSWSPQGMRVLRQCTVQRAEVMFVTIQRENIRPSKKEVNKAVTMLKLTMFAVRLWIIASPYRWPTGRFPSTCMLCTPPYCTKDVYTPQGSTRDLRAVRDSWMTVGSTEPYEMTYRHTARHDLGPESML